MVFGLLPIIMAAALDNPSATVGADLRSQLVAEVRLDELDRKVANVIDDATAGNIGKPDVQHMAAFGNGGLPDKLGRATPATKGRRDDKLSQPATKRRRDQASPLAPDKHGSGPSASPEIIGRKPSATKRRRDDKLSHPPSRKMARPPSQAEPLKAAHGSSSFRDSPSTAPIDYPTAVAYCAAAVVVAAAIARHPAWTAALAAFAIAMHAANMWDFSAALEHFERHCCCFGGPKGSLDDFFGRISSAETENRGPN